MHFAFMIFQRKMQQAEARDEVIKEHGKQQEILKKEQDMVSYCYKHTLIPTPIRSMHVKQFDITFHNCIEQL